MCEVDNNKKKKRKTHTHTEHFIILMLAGTPAKIISRKVKRELIGIKGNKNLIKIDIFIKELFINNFLNDEPLTILHYFIIHDIRA